MIEIKLENNKQDIDRILNMVVEGNKWWVRVYFLYGQCYFFRRGYWHSGRYSHTVRLGRKKATSFTVTLGVLIRPTQHWDNETGAWHLGRKVLK